ncbi:uncharacterized protein LOC134601892 [Pelobates fuscus]|uniref:uncharacterized protein LOC134601892 n=1 Tax=Pelobates fuscus TaxID=191477 RepID=UPI002FE45F18
MNLLLYLCMSALLVSCNEKKDFCADQPYGIELFAGQSVTLPCTFVFPNTWNPISVTSFALRFGNQICSNEEFSNIAAKDFNHNKNRAIFSFNVTKAGCFCCRVRLEVKSSKQQEQFQNLHGTTLTVKDKNSMTIHQPQYIPALSGDTVIIPCNYSTIDGSSISLSNVQWSTCSDKGSGPSLFNSSDKRHNSQFSLFEELAHLQIKQVNISDSGFYCCRVEWNKTGTVYSTQRVNGTQLIIKEKTNTLNINQSTEEVFQSPTTINCSFTEPQDKDPVWVGIYWVVGESRDVFAYHPDPAMIHKNYTGKTRLVGKANLLLEDFQGPDNTTFYCRVAIRSCVTTREQLNTFDMKVEEGAGTVLRFYDSSQSHSSLALFAGLIVSMIFIFIATLALFCFVKRKGRYPFFNHLLLPGKNSFHCVSNFQAAVDPSVLSSFQAVFDPCACTA